MNPDDKTQSMSLPGALFKLCSAVRKNPDIAAVCSLVCKELSELMKCDNVFYSRYSYGSAFLDLSACCLETCNGCNATKLNDESIDWIEKLSEDSVKIINRMESAPSFLREVFRPFKINALLMYIGRNEEGKISLIFALSDDTIDQSLEEDPKLLEFFRGACLALENTQTIIEINSMKSNIQSVFDLAPVGIIICDSEGNVLDANEQASVILGRNADSDNLTGLNLLENNDFKGSGIDSVLKKTLEGQNIDDENLRYKSASGKTSYIHVRFRPTIGQNGRNQAIGVMADVTQRIRLQQQLERSYHTLTEAYQELQRVDKMKTKFIDTVSHELRTPLTVVRGYIELIESEYADKIDPKVMLKIKNIKTNSERLYELVESMLDVARIEQGAIEIIKQETNLKMLIEEVVESKRLAANERHQDLTLTIVGELGLARIDARKIRDSVGHVINNAIRYTPEKGKIQVGAADEGKMIHIWIKDNGVGIPTSDLEKIFDRFHIVAAKELSHQVDRMGLGLPLTKGIVVAHGGKIWVESEINKGSVFHINLPKE